MDALQWMGAVRMRVQTADKNIHTSPVHQSTSCEAKSCMFGRNKSTIKTCLTSNHHLLVHNPYYASSSVKSSSPVVSHQIHPHICLELFWLVNRAWSVQISLLIQTRPLIHWRKQCYGGSTLKCLRMDLFLTNTQLLVSRDVNWWTGVDYCAVFISCLDSYSDGTHSLQTIHCWTSDVMLRFSKSVLIKEPKTSKSWVTWGWLNLQQIFIFGQTILWYPLTFLGTDNVHNSSVDY